MQLKSIEFSFLLYLTHVKHESYATPLPSQVLHYLTFPTFPVCNLAIIPSLVIK